MRDRLSEDIGGAIVLITVIIVAAVLVSGCASVQSNLQVHSGRPTIVVRVATN